MMNVALVGSISFYNTYKKVLAKYDVQIHSKCSMDEAVAYDKNFENLLLSCEYIFFEVIDSSTFKLITSGLKNGKNIVVEQALLSMTELNEMYHISIEGNQKCILLNSSTYYNIFEELQLEIHNPFYVEMILDYESNDMNHLSENVDKTMYDCMQNMLFILKSDIKQINVKSSKLFSNKTDFVSIQLEFSNGCTANIRMIEKPSKRSQMIHIYQTGTLFSINLLDETVTKTENQNGDLKISTVQISDIDITEKKINHFLGENKKSKIHTNTILDNYLAMEQSEKIIKKINSLYD